MRQNLLVVAMCFSQVHACSEKFHTYSGVSDVTKFVCGWRGVLDQRRHFSFFVDVTRSGGFNVVP